MIKNKLSKRFSLSSLSMFLVSGFLGSGVTAQESDQIIEEVVTVGSRVAGRTATEATVPVDVIQSEDLTKSGFTELGQSLQATAPSFNFTRSQVSDGGDLYRPATLRGLQPDQTLVLINGKRRHNQSIFQLAGTVGGGAAGTDMNSIPLTALKAVEVLRDGAAAQYGSDAIAGVINLQLKDTTDETTVFVQWGETAEGDGDTLTFGANTGFELGSDGGFVNLSIEYRDFDSTNRAHPGWFQGDAAGEFKTFFYNAVLPVGAGEFYSFGGYSERTALGSGFRRVKGSATQVVPQVYPDGFLPRITNVAEDLSLAFGYRQDFAGDWTLDASVVYGKNSYDFGSENTINASIAAEYLQNNPMATDAMITANSGPTSGLSGGRGFDQLTVNLDFAGSIGSGSNPLYIAFGAEYRDESTDSKAGILASYSCGSKAEIARIPSVIPNNSTAADGTVTVGSAGCGFQAFPGIAPAYVVDVSRSSAALYLDLEKNMADNWLLGVATRYEDYDVFGGKLTGKISTRVDLAEGFSLRGAVSTGFRAPALQQSSFQAFQTNISSAGTLEPSFTASAGSAFPSAVGVSGLKFETSNSYSMGLIWTTGNVTVTLDAYRVEIDDRIILSGLVNRTTVAGNTTATAVLDTLNVNAVSFFSNGINTSTQGVDLIVDYDTELAGGNLSITLAMNFNATKIDSFNIPANATKPQIFPSENRTFVTHGQPKERGTLSLNWGRDKVNALLRLNYFGKTEVDFFAQNHIPLPNTLPTSIVESAVLVDIDVSFDVAKNVTLSVGGNNIFDARPDVLGTNEVLNLISAGPGTGFRYPLRAVPYGFNGASYYARVAFNF